MGQIKSAGRACLALRVRDTESGSRVVNHSEREHSTKDNMDAEYRKKLSNVKAQEKAQNPCFVPFGECRNGAAKQLQSSAEWALALERILR